MEKDNVICFRNPVEFKGPVTEVIGNGTKAFIAKVVEAEARELLAHYEGFYSESGLKVVVRNGYQRRREI